MVYPREYLVRRVAAMAARDAGWDDAPWDAVEPLSLDHNMGEVPEHRPRVQARIGWDDACLCAIFRVEDRYVVARAEKHQDDVCVDSCVELFLTPGPDVAEGYFNIECNCGGTVLFHHQRSRGESVRHLDAEVIRAMEIRHSLPSQVSPEIQTPVTWTVSYQVRFADLERLAPVVRPLPGGIWRANVYKCADRSSHPHWLTWSPVERSRPDFHRKDFFGIFRFE